MPDRRLLRTTAMAASGAAIVDVTAFALLSLAGVSLEVAQASSFSLAVAVAVAILWRARGTTAAANADLRIGVAVVCALLAYALRAGVLSLLALQWGWPPLVSWASSWGWAISSLGQCCCPSRETSSW